MSPFFGCGVVLWKLIPYVSLWSVWKERNDRVFRSSSMPMEDLVHLVLLRMAKWVSSREEEFDSIKVDGILHNWEASLQCVLKGNNINVLVPSIWGVEVQCQWGSKGETRASGDWRGASQQ